MRPRTSSYNQVRSRLTQHASCLLRVRKTPCNDHIRTVTRTYTSILISHRTPGSRPLATTHHFFHDGFQPLFSGGFSVVVAEESLACAFALSASAASTATAAATTSAGGTPASVRL